MSRKLKLGDRVRILQHPDYASSWNGLFDKGDIVYVVGLVDGGTGNCPYYLSKNKTMRNGNYFGPYRTVYELIVHKNIIGGELL